MAQSAKFRVNDRMPSFRRSLHSVINDAIGEAAKDLMIEAEDNAPKKTGALRRERGFDQILEMYWRISFWQEYARYQEFGGDPPGSINNYTTPGTGPHYLRNAGDKILERMPLYLKKHARRAR